MKVVVAFVLVGCDIPFGIGGFGPRAPDAATITCDPQKAALDPEGCACDTVGAVQACYLGDRGAASRCAAGGSVTCGSDHTWSACAGATAPAQEVCFDAIDNDCDGVVDNGCTCTDASNLCLDPATGAPFPDAKLLFAPATVAVNGTFTVFGLSATYDVQPSAFQTDKGYCTGPNSTPCTTGGACAAWTAASFTLQAKVGVTTSDLFVSTGLHTVKFRVHDNPSPPCTTAPAFSISGSLTIN